ncbi:MAG: guanylate kinase [Candidatus Susulua stagnicola]|nr:guanylate kinase [Candidatus Susulua stagnicola]
MRNPKVFIISGPGGAGKTTIVEQLFARERIKKDFVKGVTITTRKKRDKEKDGKDYFFIEEDEFLRLKKNKFFLENQKVLENYYGTPKILYGLAKRTGKNLVLCIDVKGGMCLKKDLKAKKVTTIFLVAPSEKELYRRMEKRDEDKGVIKKRVKLAKKEVELSKDYDYSVINRNIKDTLKELESIILNSDK